MPQLNSDNSVQLRVETTSDKSGIEDTQKGLKDLGDSGSEADEKLGKFTGNFTSGLNKVAAVTAVAGAGLMAYSKNGVDKLQELVKSSKTLATQTGMTAVESSKLTAVFSRMGTDSSQLAANFRIFSKTIADARDNVGENALKQKELANKIQATRLQIVDLTEDMRVNGDTTGQTANKIEAMRLQLEGYEQSLNDSSNGLTKLGISTVTAEGVNKDFNAILMEVADKFKSMPGGAEKTALALDLFGRSGAGMIKVLDKGSEGIAKLSEEAEKLGLTLTNDNIETIDKYVKSQKELADSTSAISLAVGSLTAPLLTEMNVQMNNVIGSFIGADGPVKDLTVGVLAFGGPVLAASSAVIGFVANLATALPAIKAFHAAVLTPIAMPALVITAALASIAAVWDAHQKTKAAIEQSQSLQKTEHETSMTLIRVAKEKKASGAIGDAEYKRLLMVAGKTPGQNATGTNSWVGGRTWVGENGPELIDAPQGSKIYTNRDSQRLAGQEGSRIIQIQNVNLNGGDAVTTFFDHKDVDAQNALIGLSHSRGIA